MAGTPASGTSSYCTPGQFLKHYDSRSVAELLSDETTPVSSDDVEDDETLAQLLAASSGEIEAAACAGQRYVINDSRNDLASLTGNSAAFLASMVAHLTMWNLWSRRPSFMTPTTEPPLCKKALEFLERLRLGERVFGILENHQAAALDASDDTRQNVEDRRGIVYEASRLFGTRVNRSGQ